MPCSTTGTWHSTAACVLSERGRVGVAGFAASNQGTCGPCGREGGDVDSDAFPDFLNEFSRRDFLKRAGGAAGLAMVLGSGLEVLAACGGGSQTQAPTA